MKKNEEDRFGLAMSELSVRCARAEIERDKLKADYEQLWRLYTAVMSGDKDKLMETLHVCGIPVRDLKEIYELESKHRQRNGAR